ncbi:MAG: hydroxymethylbilane synthase, partial [Gemmatimonadetes bacterium]|nr:hydroxymethylbilane synthase [Gemmatimonadota bacterium]
MVALRIASRGSELALWQSRAVEAALRAADPSLEVRIDVIRTTGDRIQDVPLAKIGDKGLFTKELDSALLAGDADLAVHSLKDVPTRLPEGLALAAVTVREDPRDVVLLAPGRTSGLDALEPGARVGTSSLRRRAQLQALRPDLEVLDLRGNLNTRLAKLDRGDYDAIILAAAGVRRLGWEDRISESLDPGQWLPAVGQGALAVVCRADRPDVLDRLRALHDPLTAACTTAERALLRALEGGCQVPIGALGRVDGDRLVLDGLVADTDGTRILRVQESGPVDDAHEIGRRAADALLTVDDFKPGGSQ